MLKIISIGETKEAKDLRFYYKAEFKDSANFFSKPVSRVIFQRTTPTGNVWDADPKDAKKMIGVEIPGAIVSKVVPDYDITDAAGETRTVNTYTAVVLGHENTLSVFKSAGHDYTELDKETTQQTEGFVMDVEL